MTDTSYDTDENLGMEIHAILKQANLETPFFGYEGRVTHAHKLKNVAESFKHIMGNMDLNLDDDSLSDTPKRVAKMYCEEIFVGLDYCNFPKCTTIPNTMGYDEMLIVHASVKSMCEHHFMPIYGKATIGYIPGSKVLGLSKFNRVVDFFSRRPQVQERLTAQIQRALHHILDTADVGVIITAEHFCVKFRGVQDDAGPTTTSDLGGKFRDGTVRSEFLSLAR